jgi:hypothetical protein
MRLTRFSVTVGAFLFLISGIVSFPGYRSRITSNQIFGNMTYLSNSPYFSESGKVSLMNDRYDWSHTSEDDVFVHYHLQYNRRYVHGDFNHDGLKDAAVIIAENSGGTAEWYSVAFLINNGKKLMHQASGYLGDRAIINSMRQKNGKVLVDMFVHQDGDCMAGPTHHVVDTFEYGGDGQRIEGVRISAKSVFDPLILMLKDPSSLLNLPSWEYVLTRCKI